MTDEDIDRRYEGRAALDALLTASGALADTEDVVEAFRTAVAQQVPAAAVIEALWDDEPRFTTPSEARRLFGNLLALFELVEAGAPIDLQVPARPAPRQRATRPPAFGPGGPDEEALAAAAAYLHDAPKERARLDDVFDNRQDALLGWVDAQGLDDEAFVLACALLRELHALLEVGGLSCGVVAEGDLPASASLPVALEGWLEEGVREAEAHDEVPLSEADAERVKGIVGRAASALWTRRRSRPLPLSS